jgi:hypothetical protein
MGKIVSNFFISLDNVVEAPDQWHFSYFDDEMGAVVGRGVANTKAFLMGRKLYSEWSQYWPDKTEDFGAFINGPVRRRRADRGPAARHQGPARRRHLDVRLGHDRTVAACPWSSG